MFDREELERHRWHVVVLAGEGQERHLVEFLDQHRERLGGWRLSTTPDIAVRLAAQSGLAIRGHVSEAWADDDWLRTQMIAGEVDALIVLGDPSLARREDPALAAIHALADALNIPIATNQATAWCVVTSLRSSKVSLAPFR